MANPELDWPRLWLEAVGSVVSAIAGLFVGIWRWGRHSALRDMRIRDDYLARIEEMKAAIAADAHEQEIRLDELTEQVKENFTGMRRKIDDNRLLLEQQFVRKDDFREFREEYREDMRDVKRMISEIKS